MARAAHLPLSSPRRSESGGEIDPVSPASPRGGSPLKEKGRGARSNQSGRYEAEQREAIDDGWSICDDEDGFSGSPVLTDVTIENPRKIITFNQSPFVGFDRSINPYRGCEHGCIYCFARPTHAYMGLSAGLDFESKLFAKPSASRLLEKELSKPSYKPRAVAMGTNTDPYQPIERRFQIMRGVLTTFSRFNHPVTILTKSHLITRDTDILAPMAAVNLTRAMLSITTLDKKLARAMEPRASAPGRRFDAVKELSEAGVPVGVMTAPMIPGLNDDELEELLERAKEAGASYVGYTIIRLPLEISSLFQEWLETFAPNRARRVMSHIRDMNGGKDYDIEWSRGGEIKSVYAKLISKRFRMATKRLGLATQTPSLDLSKFRVPGEEQTKQMNLFD